MTTSMMTTATTMMTNMVVVPSVGRLLEGCVLLLELTGTVAVVVIALSVLNAEERKHTNKHRIVKVISTLF